MFSLISFEKSDFPGFFPNRRDPVYTDPPPLWVPKA